MNSLPPFAANTNESNHPALESIAAYLDGRLPENERSALTAHLHSCPACYEIYTESLRFQKEESAEARRAILPFEPRKVSWMSTPQFRSFALPLAALLLVGVGAATWYQLHLPFEPQEVVILTESLRTPDESMLAQLGPFDTNRGLPEPTVNYPVAAFQSGATLVDLRVATETNDPERIGIVAHNLSALYNTGAIVPEEREKKEVEVAINRFLNGDGSPKLYEMRMSALHSLQTILRENYPDPLSRHFDLGTWIEAGRLAVYGDRPSFFSERINRRSLRWFRRNLPQPEKPEVKAALEKIDDAWPESSLTPAAQKPLAMGFEEVIHSYNVSLTEE